MQTNVCDCILEKEIKYYHLRWAGGGEADRPRRGMFNNYFFAYRRTRNPLNLNTELTFLCDF